MSLPEENEIRARNIGNGLNHGTLLSKGCGGDEREIPLFYGHNLRSEWSNAETPPGSNLLPISSLSASGLELPTINSVTLPHGTWSQLLEPSFPNQLEQMSLGLPTSEEYLRHPLDFLSPCNQPMPLGYDYSHPVIYSSPDYQLSETKSFVENPLPESSTFHPSVSNTDFFSRVTTGQEACQYGTLSQEISPGVSSCSSGPNLAMLSIPSSLDYPSPDAYRAPPLLAFKRSLSILNTVTHNTPEIKESFPGFEGAEGTIPAQDLFVVSPNSTSKYPANIEGFLDEGCSLQPSWDIQTHSSSSRSSSYDQSNSEPIRYSEAATPNYFSSSTPTLIPSLSSSDFFNGKILGRGSSHEPEKRSAYNKKQDSPKASASRDFQSNQRRIGSLIDIHHLTTHVPRRRLTVEQEQILLRRFAVQEYLSKREMEELAERLKIPTSQLRTWFGNRRSKLKAAARQKAKIEAGMGHLTDAELRNLNKTT